MENREEKRIPEWGRISHHCMYWAIIVILAIMTGCGARKSSVDINKSSDKQSSEISTQGQVKKESGSEDVKSNEETSSKEQLYWGKKIEEIFNPDGTLKSRVTSEEKGVNKETVRRTELSRRTQFHRIDSVFKKNEVVTTYRTVYSKSKDTESNNNQWVWVVGAVCLLLWWKPWK